MIAAPHAAGAVTAAELPGQDFLEENRLLPRARAAGRLVVGYAGRPDPQAVSELEMMFGLPVTLEPAAEHDLLDEIRRACGQPTAATLAADLEGDAPAGSLDADLVAHDLEAAANQAPVVRLVNLLLAEALEAGASDVHLEAESRAIRVRYRVDGVLQEAPSPPAHLRAAVVSRLKIMAELDIAERRLPQDGRVRLRAEGRELDVRVSTLPTLHGESVVLRLLDVEGQRIGLDAMGMAEDTLAALLGFAARPHGVLLATGPTGSGKTTTLYALLDRIRTGREKIISVEDPVEYELAGVAQVPVHPRVGLTFARALRSILRQDPDVLLVGEMRDPETAEICIQAALTGHLVLSTLHTNDAPGALTRLIDLAVPDYLVASTVAAVLAQRLVRKVCAACAEPAAPEPPVAREMAAAGFAATHVRRGRGCPACRGTGYRGRTGIYELLSVDDALRAGLLRAPGTDARRRRAAARARRRRAAPHRPRARDAAAARGRLAPGAGRRHHPRGSAEGGMKTIHPHPRIHRRPGFDGLATEPATARMSPPPPGSLGGGGRGERARGAGGRVGVSVRRRFARRGFTLIELLVVIVVITVLATLVAPNVFRHVGSAKEATARTQLEMLTSAIDAYRLDNDAYPTTEQGLAALRTRPQPEPRGWRGPYLRRDVPVDPWGRPYLYRSPGTANPDAFDLLTLGRDGREGGEGEDADVLGWK